MRILFARPGPFPPELYAGTELTLHGLCRKLVANGHEVTLAAQSKLMKGEAAIVGDKLGYPVTRATSILKAMHAAMANFRPDVVVITETGAWLDATRPIVGKIPLVIYEHEVAVAVGGIPADIKSRAVFVANSAATAENIRKLCDVEVTIVRPLFGVDRYAHIKPSGNSVLFVSLQRRKGSDVAIRLAENRPRVPFIFVESWTETPERTDFLRNYVRKIPNVTLLPNQPTLDSVLPKIKLHLMPSRSQEAWGRTATEAQICGIPVLGSSRGNLPTTIGPGGVTLDPEEPIERWLEAFDRIMGDSAYYEELSRKARAHGRAKIDELNHAYQAFEAALGQAQARGRA